MSEISGVNGAVYYNAELTDTATTGNLTFSTGKTITSSGDTLNFATEGYSTGMLVQVEGCIYAVGSSGVTTTGNNKIYTITNVSSGILTVNESVQKSTGEAGAVIFTEYDPGIELCGFYNWTINYVSGIHETTAFCNSSDGKAFIPSVTEWSATADKYFLTANNVVDDWIGTDVKVRFFTKYVASPESTNPSQYWEGDMLVTGIDETTPVDALVTQNLSFQGKGALTLTTKTNAWNTT